MATATHIAHDSQLLIPTAERTRTWHRAPLWYPGSSLPFLSPADRAGWEGGNFVSKDVLVIEDESYLCELLSDVIESEGHTARKASNGLEALERMKERKPELVLLDLMMPIMDGWEFMEALR